MKDRHENAQLHLAWLDIFSLAALLGFVLTAIWLAVLVWTDLDPTKPSLRLSSTLVCMASALVGMVSSIVSSSWRSDGARAQIATTYFSAYLLVGFLLVVTWIHAGSSAPEGLVSIATAWIGAVTGMTAAHAHAGACTCAADRK